ncbi:AraC family transcriptional regulator [Fodinicurvata sp. EGI_FJ10296]|uniref:AraC family transcriptional regulator n=1 Tax=Fodinicurvata sp. EGI_FJ10296 TaxID=3231908 RepID=UPI00345561EF
MMPGSQASVLDTSCLSRDEAATLWRVPRHNGLECLRASFRRHRYAPHTHETYVIGVITHGCETFRCRGVRHYAGPGALTIVNPEEVHDGEPADTGYVYRMTYPDRALIADIASEVFARRVDTPYCDGPLFDDPELAAAFVAAHRAAEDAGTPTLEADSRLIGVYGDVLRRYGHIGSAIPVGREPMAIRRARDYIHEHMASDIDLGDLAAVAGLTRYHLIRAFKAHVGLTPHAYLLDLRVRTARRLLRHGADLADAATACGFYDQSHLNRAFKARVGVTPGRYRPSA